MSYLIIANIVIVIFITLVGASQTIKRRKIETNTLYMDNFTVYLTWIAVSIFLPLPIHQLIILGEIPYWLLTIAIMCTCLGMALYYLNLKITFCDTHLSKTSLFFPEQTYPLKSLLCISYGAGDANTSAKGYILEFSFGDLAIPIEYINIDGLLKFLKEKGFTIPSATAI
ncbi:MAG: hypothetical protein ACI9J4_001056 [Paraglaciecola sp.]